MSKKKIELEPKGIRQVIVRVHPLALTGLFMEGNKIHVKKGILAGSRYVGGGYDPATNAFFIHLASDRFDEVPLGERIPVLNIEIEQLQGEEDAPKK